MTKKLKGAPIDVTSLNMTFLGSLDPDAINMDSDELRMLWNELKPKVDPENSGKVIITSTIDDDTHFEEIFYNELLNNG